MGSEAAFSLQFFGQKQGKIKVMRYNICHNMMKQAAKTAASILLLPSGKRMMAKIKLTPACFLFLL